MSCFQDFHLIESYEVSKNYEISVVRLDILHYLPFIGSSVRLRTERGVQGELVKCTLSCTIGLSGHGDKNPSKSDI